MRARVDTAVVGNQGREAWRSSTGCRRRRSRPEAADAEGSSGGDNGVAGEKRNEGERREEWLGRLAGPEPVLDLVQPSWTKDLLVILQKILNQIQFNSYSKMKI